MATDTLTHTDIAQPATAYEELQLKKEQKW
jgi:hypothetical protein